MLLTLALAVPAPHAATDLTNGKSVSVSPAVLASHASASGWTGSLVFENIIPFFSTALMLLRKVYYNSLLHASALQRPAGRRSGTWVDKLVAPLHQLLAAFSRRN